MPRKAAQPSLADTDAAPGGAAAVDRALSLLNAFGAGDASLSLAELARRTGLYKSTVLRLLASLRHAGLLRQLADGHYALGPAVARLHAVYAASFSIDQDVQPVLRTLVDQTRESAAFHVRQGAQRLCLYRVDSPQVLRDHVRMGDVLPLDRGAGGHVLMAWSGYAVGTATPLSPQHAELHAQIRRDGVIVLSGDRVPDLTGISAPVFKAGGELVGALTLTLPTSRLQAGFAPAVLAAARGLSAQWGHEGPLPA